MARYSLIMDYIGTDFCGWQTQPSLRTVQGVLTEAIKSLTGETVNTVGSGRTDAGVHAIMQTAHFDLEKEWEIEKLASGLNYYLPSDVRILKACRCDDDFHARFDCKEKSYLYLMYRLPERAVWKNRAYAVDREIDVSAMQRAAERFVGEKDFAAFMGSNSDVKSTVRTVTAASVIERDGRIEFVVSANGFLYNMVRIMTAVLLFVGIGKLEAETVDALIAGKDRTAIKGMAPPYGLYLLNQSY